MAFTVKAVLDAVEAAAASRSDVPIRYVSLLQSELRLAEPLKLQQLALYFRQSGLPDAATTALLRNLLAPFHVSSGRLAATHSALV